jgi:hypothetical protein
MSEKKRKNNLPDLLAPESLSPQSGEGLIESLRARAERFYQEASLEEIIQLGGLVESLLETRGLLPKGPHQIH